MKILGFVMLGLVFPIVFGITADVGNFAEGFFAGLFFDAILIAILGGLYLIIRY